jgi:hypothetical protein
MGSKLSFAIARWCIVHRRARPGRPCGYLRAPAVLVVPTPAAGPPVVPDPVPIVSPVVPLFMAPLLMPAPGLGRSLRLAPPAGFVAAGETAASPGGVLELELAFCASASELVRTSADAAAIHVFFISIFLVPLPRMQPVSPAAGHAYLVKSEPRRNNHRHRERGPSPTPHCAHISARP